MASEAVRLIQSRDASVVSSLAALDALCTDPQVSLHSIIYQIETDIHAAEPNTQVGLKSGQSVCLFPSVFVSVSISVFCLSPVCLCLSVYFSLSVFDALHTSLHI